MTAHRLRNAFVFSFKVALVLALLGALVGALLVGFVPDCHVLWGDDLIDGASAVGFGALGGAIAMIVLSLVTFFLIALFGLVLPTLLLAVLLLVALVIVVVALSTLGGLALAFSPLLLVGFGCVLLLRALFGRPRNPHVNVPT